MSSVSVAFTEVVVMSVSVAFTEVVVMSVSVAFTEVVVMSVSVAFTEVVVMSVSVAFTEVSSANAKRTRFEDDSESSKDVGNTDGLIISPVTRTENKKNRLRFLLINKVQNRVSFKICAKILPNMRLTKNYFLNVVYSIR